MYLRNVKGFVEKHFLVLFAVSALIVSWFSTSSTVSLVAKLLTLISLTMYLIKSRSLRVDRAKRKRQSKQLFALIVDQASGPGIYTLEVQPDGFEVEIMVGKPRRFTGGYILVVLSQKACVISNDCETMYRISTRYELISLVDLVRKNTDVIVIRGDNSVVETLADTPKQNLWASLRAEIRAPEELPYADIDELTKLQNLLRSGGRLHRIEQS